jgi:hypothetical protein
LHPDNADFNPVQPGNIGGVKPKPATMAGFPEPKVIEVEGTDATDVERTETAKPGDTVKPVATDEEMYKVNYASNFRASGEQTKDQQFAEPTDRGPHVEPESEDDEPFEMDGEQMKRFAVDKGTLAQGDINITIHGPKKPPEEKTEKGSGDFTDCMDRIVPKVKPDDPEAFCAWYEHEQTGHWPGEKRASKSHDAFLDGPSLQ